MDDLHQDDSWRSYSEARSSGEVRFTLTGTTMKLLAIALLLRNSGKGSERDEEKKKLLSILQAYSSL